MRETHDPNLVQWSWVSERKKVVVVKHSKIVGTGPEAKLVVAPLRSGPLQLHWHQSADVSPV